MQITNSSFASQAGHLGEVDLIRGQAYNDLIASDFHTFRLSWWPPKRGICYKTLLPETHCACLLNIIFFCLWVHEWDLKIKAIDEYFPVVLTIMVYNAILTLYPEDKILERDHSNESYWAVLSCGAVYYAVQGGSNFWICE